MFHAQPRLQILLNWRIKPFTQTMPTDSCLYVRAYIFGTVLNDDLP